MCRDREHGVFAKRPGPSATSPSACFWRALLPAAARMAASPSRRDQGSLCPSSPAVDREQGSGLQEKPLQGAGGCRSADVDVGGRPSRRGHGGTRREAARTAAQSEETDGVHENLGWPKRRRSVPSGMRTIRSCPGDGARGFLFARERPPREGGRELRALPSGVQASSAFTPRRLRGRRGHAQRPWGGHGLARRHGGPAALRIDSHGPHLPARRRARCRSEIAGLRQKPRGQRRDNWNGNARRGPQFRGTHARVRPISRLRGGLPTSLTDSEVRAQQTSSLPGPRTSTNYDRQPCLAWAQGRRHSFPPGRGPGSWPSLSARGFRWAGGRSANLARGGPRGSGTGGGVVFGRSRETSTNRIRVRTSAAGLPEDHGEVKAWSRPRSKAGRRDAGRARSPKDRASTTCWSACAAPAFCGVVPTCTSTK
jgi:hypothetical protein